MNPIAKELKGSRVFLATHTGKLGGDWTKIIGVYTSRVEASCGIGRWVEREVGVGRAYPATPADWEKDCYIVTLKLNEEN